MQKPSKARVLLQMKVYAYEDSLTGTKLISATQLVC